MVLTVLHVGCGPYDPAALPEFFRNGEWREIRLDIDPEAKPDIVASMTEMGAVADESADALYAAHNLEHLYPHEVPLALAEFKRVLSPEGIALIVLPDLQTIAARVAEGRLDDMAYMSPEGPISPHDMIYGFRPSLARGNLYMAHRTGFTAHTLQTALFAAGFVGASIQRNPGRFAIWALAFKRRLPEATVRTWQKGCFPLPLEPPA
jgi:hypothetical protein